jgi:hypothetical protein
MGIFLENYRWKTKAMPNAYARMTGAGQSFPVPKAQIDPVTQDILKDSAGNPAPPIMPHLEAFLDMEIWETKDDYLAGRPSVEQKREVFTSQADLVACITGIIPAGEQGSANGLKAVAEYCIRDAVKFPQWVGVRD